MYNSLVHDNNGKPIGMAATLRDITELKKYERALREINQEKETFLNSLVEHIDKRDGDKRNIRYVRWFC